MPLTGQLSGVSLAPLLRYDIAANVAGLALMLGEYGMVSSRPEFLLLAVLIAAHLALDVWLYRQVHRRDGVQIVLICTAGLWVVAIVVTGLAPEAVVLMTIAALLPAVLAVPYLGRQALLRLVIGVMAVTAVLAVESRHASGTSLGAVVPSWLDDAVLIIYVPLMTGAVILLLWRHNAWIGQALAAAEDANRALQRSRREVEEQAVQLRVSRARVVAAADAERRRMERDLHDGAQQVLVAAAVTARRAQQLCSRDPAAAEHILDQVLDQLDRAGGQLRDLANGIYPASLTAHGLVAALSLAAQESPLTVRVSGHQVRRYPAEVEAAAYFCCLEALQNAAKHAGPGATVQLELAATSGEELSCTITDDGAGFDPDTCRAGQGLDNLADRVASAGGSLDVTSAPGRGTRIAVRLPVTQVRSMPGSSG